MSATALLLCETRKSRTHASSARSQTLNSNEGAEPPDTSTFASALTARPSRHSKKRLGGGAYSSTTPAE